MRLNFKRPSKWVVGTGKDKTKQNKHPCTLRSPWPAVSWNLRRVQGKSWMLSEKAWGAIHSQNFQPAGWNANGTHGSNWNSKTTFGSTPLFPLQLVGTEINVPFAQNFHFYCSRLCLRLAPSRSTNEIACFSPLSAWKKPFFLIRKISGISNQKIWLNG